MVKPKKTTKADLQRYIKELRAQMIHVPHFATVDLHKAGGLGGSAVILELTHLGGKQIIPPIAINGGLSDDTIAAIRRDIVRSYEDKLSLKPVATDKVVKR